MTEVKNLKTPSGCSAFGFWSFAHDGGSICDINNDDCEFDKSLDSCPVVESYIKSNLVSMLTEIQLDIQEKATELCDDGWWLTYNNLIQEKINSLKGEE